MPPDPAPTRKVPDLTVDIDVRTTVWTDTLPDVDAICHRAVIAAWRQIDSVDQPHEVSIVLADDAFQRGLNTQYRGKDTSTNVLSFPSGIDIAQVPAEVAVALGDIILAYETLVRESESLGISLEDHFSHLLVHGMLHLVGFDHESERDAEEMENLEVDVLATLGVANPYLLDPTPVDARS